MKIKRTEHTERNGSLVLTTYGSIFGGYRLLSGTELTDQTILELTLGLSLGLSEVNDTQITIKCDNRKTDLDREKYADLVVATNDDVILVWVDK